MAHKKKPKKVSGAGIGEDEMSGCLIWSVWICVAKLEIYFIIAFTDVLGCRVEFDKIYRCIQAKVALDLMHFEF